MYMYLSSYLRVYHKMCSSKQPLKVVHANGDSNGETNGRPQGVPPSNPLDKVKQKKYP